MRRFMRFMLTVLVAVGVAVAAARTVSGEEFKAPVAAGSEDAAVYSTAVRLPGRRVDSVLTNPQGALRARPGSGWLLHSGTPDDTCVRADATSGLRVVCLAW